MKFYTVLLAIISAVLMVIASSSHDDLNLSSRHIRPARRSSLLNRQVITRRCANRNGKAKANKAVPIQSSPSLPKQTATNQISNTNVPTGTGASNSGGSKPAGNTLQVQSDCGDSRATPHTSAESGPNGHIDWLNCGVNNGGWKPPYVTVENVIAVSLSDAVGSGKGPYMACSPFVYLFEKYGRQFGVPPIILAAFAMQESSCNPRTVGGAGEQGLMQLTHDKCGGAPGGDCQDPDFNVYTGAKYFADTLRYNSGNLILSIGLYNGWSPGMTYSEATAARYSNCCRCQNNLDYLHQFLNGWLQNINAYSSAPPLGKYFNLNPCH